LAAVAEKQLRGNLNPPATALLTRVAPVLALETPDESVVEAAVRISASMSGGCLVIQGPPGTGKTYTAAQMIRGLLAAGKKVGVVSNSHKAVTHLLEACGKAFREVGASLTGIKVAGVGDGALFDDNPAFRHVEKAANAKDAYSAGVVGGTAWLFCRPEWEDVLDFLFVDEAGQVSLANTVAMTRCTRNLVLLGDQMQLEQPIQGAHPGDSGLSGLQYALKDLKTSRMDPPASIRIRIGDGRIRIQNTAISASVVEKRIACRLIDIPNDASAMDLLSLPSIFTLDEIEGSGLHTMVLNAQQGIANGLDSAARSLNQYSFTRGELAVMAETKVRAHTMTMRRVLYPGESSAETMGGPGLEPTSRNVEEPRRAEPRITESEMQAELSRLRAENAQLKTRDKVGISLKVSEKGALSLYGMGRFPVTLYKEQWLRILAGAAEIETFIRENESRLKAKNRTTSES
jgi:AAA domain